jgi:glutamate synthase domain-containing protein 1
VFLRLQLSSLTIVYMGLMSAPQVPHFYPDLADPLFKSALAVVHQRYSTNTFPSWELAQPFRYLAHNGKSTLYAATSTPCARVSAIFALISLAPTLASCYL